MDDSEETPIVAGTGLTRSDLSGVIETVGPYTVKEVLGEGGMGVVYLAEQHEPVSRQLAVKVIRADLTAPEVAARFAAERQALARLSHPNIAQLYEAGTTAEGHPYFAMEYFPGVAITDYCDQHRLSVEQRLHLFTTICEAVQHAHQRGIIHRDLKPSNILVGEIDGRPAAKIIDFGIAKAIDRPLTDALELTGVRVIGTPAYMSPESLRLDEGAGDVDTRTDGYALGVLLYELLTGMRPFETRGASMAKVMARIASEEAPRPSARLSSESDESRAEVAHRRRIETSALRRRLVGDLDWIVCKAMAKNREERYASVTELAADTRRHLRHEPVLAGPPGVRYRLGKFVRRHRAGVAAAAVAIAALVLGTVGTTAAMLRAKKEAESARRALAETEEMSQFLTGLFTVSDPRTARGETITAREILDKGAQDIRSRLADQPRSRAGVMRTIGNIYMQLGLYDRAGPLLEEDLEIREALVDSDPLDIASSLRGLGVLGYHQGRYQDAEQYYTRALQLQEQHLDLQDPEVAATAHNLAAVLHRRGDYDQAEPLYQRALDIRVEALGADHLEVAKSLSGLASLYQNKGAYEQAEPLYRRALEIRERELGNDHPYVAFCLVNLGVLYRVQGRLDEAEPLFLRALEIREKVLGPDHPDVANTLLNLGIVYRSQERNDEAEPLYRRALEIQERALGPDHPRVGITLNSIGVFYFHLSRFEDAERFYLQALEIQEKKLGSDHLSTMNVASNLGLVYWKQGKLPAAERHLRQALVAMEEKLGSDHPRLARSLWGLAGAYRDQGRHDDAERHYRRALEIWEKALPAGHRDLNAVRADYAVLLRATGRLQEAAEIEGRLGR